MRPTRRDLPLSTAFLILYRPKKSAPRLNSHGAAGLEVKAESMESANDANKRRAVLAALKPNEKLPYLVGHALNESPWGKRLGMGWTRVGARPFLNQFIHRRTELRGAEHLPRRSFILACNHRTWFDLYALTIAFWPMYEDVPFLYCPVRSNYYYEGLTGTVLNIAVSGNAMYPPIFRDDRGRTLNRLAIETCTRLLESSPRTIIGIHPEGTRNAADSPYDLLPPKPGIGHIALHSGAPIIPAFVAGLPRAFGQIVRERNSTDAEPIRVWIGPPVAYDDVHALGESRENAHTVAARVMASIAALGAQDRAYMAERRG